MYYSSDHLTNSINKTNNNNDRKQELQKLFSAIASKNFELVKTLCDGDIDVNQHDDFSQTPLRVALNNFQFDIVQLLCEKGADVNQWIDESGITPLHYAVLDKNVALAKLFCNCKADPNCVDGLGCAPIFYAVANNQVEMVELLCKQGADVDLRNADGKTPFDLALMIRNTKLLKVLKPELNDEQIQKLYAQRNFITSFGPSKLLSSNDIHRFDGDIPDTAIKIVADTLEQFTKDNAESQPRSNQSIALQNINNQFKAISSNEHLSVEEQIKFLQKSNTLLFFLRDHSVYESSSHFVGASLKKLVNDQYELTLADRNKDHFGMSKNGFEIFVNLFGNRLTLNSPNQNITEFDKEKLDSEHRLGIMSIVIAERDLAWVLNQLKYIENPNVDTRNLIYNVIPEQLQTKWKYNENLPQKKLHDGAGTCCHSNLKSLLLNEFAHAFGDKKAHQIYKKFTLFSRKKALVDYKKISSSDDRYVVKAESILLSKENSYRNHFDFNTKLNC